MSTEPRRGLPVLSIAGLIVLAAVVFGYAAPSWLWLSAGLLLWPLIVIGVLLIGFAAFAIAVIGGAVVIDLVEMRRRRSVLSRIRR